MKKVKVDPHGDRKIVSFLLPLERPMAIPAPNGFVNPRPEDVPWLGQVHLPKPFDDEIFRSGKNFVAFSPYQSGGERVIDSKPLALAKVAADGIAQSYEVGTSIEWPEDVSVGFGLKYTTLRMTTVLLSDGKKSERATIGEALDRCFESLRAFELAYCVTSADIAYPLTTTISASSACYMTIFSVDSGQWSEPALVVVNITDGIREFPPDFIEAESIAEIVDRISLARVGFPLSSSEYWMREAERSLYLLGKTDISAVQAFTAGEVYLDSVLMMLAWEEIAFAQENGSLSKADVAAWYSFQSTHGWRINNQFHVRLRGWNSGPVPRPPNNWLDVAAKIRSKVVHTGHIPSFEEAEQVLDCYREVVEFIKICLVSDGNRTRYPKTASMVLSKAGLERHGVFVGAIKRMWESEGNGVSMEQFMEFQEEVRQLIVAPPPRL